MNLGYVGILDYQWCLGWCHLLSRSQIVHTVPSSDVHRGYLDHDWWRSALGTTIINAARSRDDKTTQNISSAQVELVLANARSAKLDYM
jgi:hypothetical protein